MTLTVDPGSSAFAIELSAAETAILATSFALLAALLTILILKTRDRILARRTPVAAQDLPWQVVQTPIPPVGVAPGVTPQVIPGYCPNCGMATRSRAVFCEKCGRRLLQG